MSAFLSVTKRELAIMHRSRTLWLLIALVSLIGIGTAVLEHRAWAEESAQRGNLQQQEIGQWLGLGDTHFHTAAHRGLFLVQPIPAGVILDRGVWDFSGSAIWLEAHQRNAAQLRAVDAQAFIGRGLPRGVGPVLLWIAPLLTIVLFHGIVASDRRSGVLAFSVSSGAPPGAIALGKFAALSIAGLVAITAPAVLAIGLATSGGLAIIDGLAWLSALAATILIASAVIVAVSAASKRTVNALILLLMLWFVAVVLWPRVAAQVTQIVAPLPSSQVVRSEAEALVHDLDFSKAEERIAEQLREEGIAQPTPAAVNIMASETATAEALVPLFAPLEDGMARQAAWMDWLSLASPLFAADRYLDGVATTSDRDQIAFEQDAEEARLAAQLAMGREWAKVEGGDAGSPEAWGAVIDASFAQIEERDARPLGPMGVVLWLIIAAGLLALSIRSVRAAAA
ncbi:ABC transporter permease subunit [Erythrobacter sp. YT30]|uniref:ABC transporter permease subunit n=1 Tax=Erythrobacter sp. YT30 TaxID=1735012 RepID=UPI00076C4B18|nr:ABC transporter permease subunit [Erythrobacter sp. YT30]KWV92016.1 hypothetical protein AUC45_12745 [Erythrobacter sp. YT30]